MDLSGRCNLVVLMGNHEEMLLDAMDSPSELGNWLYSGGRPTLNSYGRGRAGHDPRGPRPVHPWMPGLLRDPTHIFVHANYDRWLPMDRIGGTKLRWEHIEPHDQRPHFSGRTVVVGHTPQVSGEVSIWASWSASTRIAAGAAGSRRSKP